MSPEQQPAAPSTVEGGSPIDRYLAHNQAHEDLLPRDLPSPPADRVAVVTCMDARLDVYRVLGLSSGQAHVIRNAGGIVTDDVVRSLSVSQRLLGTRSVMLVQHERCGMLAADDDAFAEQLERDTGRRPSWRLGGFADLEDSVRSGVRRLRAEPFLAQHDDVRGFVVDVSGGRLREVDVPAE
ncbi:carbonic anhydrase [Kineococcus xinjiangensis]|uniref:carbonic anhydrase n=1 Tax=Kineococcus xinjiangensis TaxID=512762 RepID=A0A2S6ID10_9ACTN|nr:carbonic anhydrase [Kineococcus xinjiangensis]PPK92050.1 carbonic anhydrase [Kineococcus xinjiangensis]